MKRLLREMDLNKTINSRQFKEMVGRNFTIDFPFTMSDFSTVDSSYGFDELYLFVNEKQTLLDMQDEEKQIVLTEERYNRIDSLRLQIGLMLEELTYIENNLENKNISEIKLIADHADGLMFHEDRHLNILFNETEMLVTRSLRPNDTRQFLSKLNVNSDIDIFALAFEDTKLTFQKKHKPKHKISFAETLHVIKSGKVRDMLKSLVTVLDMEYCTLKPTTDLNMMPFEDHNDFTNICQLLTSITEI